MREKVEIRGMKETLDNIENTLGDNKMRSVARKAINAGAQKVEAQLKRDLVVFRDTGATIDEVVRQNARQINYKTEAAIGWNGPKKRYRLVHLNEWGYTRKGAQIRPRGFGVIAKSLKSSESMYLNTVVEEVKRSL